MKWDLTYLYENEQAYEKAFNELPLYVEKLAQYKGKLSDEKSFVEFILSRKIKVFKP